MDYNKFSSNLLYNTMLNEPIKDFDSMLRSGSEKTAEEVGEAIRNHVEEIVGPALKNLSINDLKEMASRMMADRVAIDNRMKALFDSPGFGYITEYYKSEICDFCIEYAAEKNKEKQKSETKKVEVEKQENKKQGFFSKLFKRHDDDKTL